jgi:hypothetical protein
LSLDKKVEIVFMVLWGSLVLTALAPAIIEVFHI